MEKETWKIGELASKAGITVRTLHHYHQIGLLIPSGATEAGHRLYTEPDIVKLQQILSLKQMGISLEEIGSIIEKPDYNPIHIIKAQLESINEEIRLKERLRNELEQLHTFLLYKKSISTEQLFKLMAAIQMNKKNHLTNEQIEKLKKLEGSLTEEQKQNLQKEWDKFISDLKCHTENNTPITDPSARSLALYWKSIADRFTGNDDEILKAAERFHASNPNSPISFGMTPEMYKYLITAAEKL